MKMMIPPVENEGFQMAPMIDITFLLIIFFMVVAQQSQAQLKPIPVPIAEHSTMPDDRSNRGIITLEPDDLLYVGANPTTIDQLGPLVKDSATQNPRLRIFLRVHRDVPFKRVREVMKACADAGVLDVIFATYQTDK